LSCHLYEQGACLVVRLAHITSSQIVTQVTVVKTKLQAATGGSNRSQQQQKKSTAKSGMCRPFLSARQAATLGCAHAEQQRPRHQPAPNQPGSSNAGNSQVQQ
jgi:hypothetical protein